MGKTILTGIKPTGAPHLGNYFGAIRPAVELIAKNDGPGFVFIANVHALNGQKDPEFIREKTYEVAATFLAAGLEPSRTTFYRQSDVPEIFELTSLFMNFTPKGLMNRAHAYKAAVDKDGGDDGVNMGLYTYPILMAADIMAMDADLVPVGLDQKQHVEIARDIANSFNSYYNEGVLKVPGVFIQHESSVIGLDGRKMSKSYGNTIELFAPPEDTARKVVKIPTDSLPPEVPKDDGSTIYRIMQLAGVEEDYRREFLAGGIGYGEAKKVLARALNAMLAPVRAKYAGLMADRKAIDKLFREGAERARKTASATLARVKRTLGLA